MTDSSEEELVRRMKNRPFSLGVAICALLLVACALALVFRPFMTGPSSRESLEKILTDSPPPVPPDSSPDPLRTIVNRFQAFRDAGTKLPGGADLVYAQTVPVLYTSGNGYFATGFIVRDSIVVTAAHLLDAGMSGARIYVDCGAGPQEAEIITCDHVHDVLVIAAAQCRGQALPLNTRRISTSDKLYRTGYNFNETSDGMVANQFAEATSLSPDDDKDPANCNDCSEVFKASVRQAQVPDLMAITGSSIKGNSGSPVMMEKGAIVGMIVQLHGDRPLSYMVSAASIDRVLRHIGIE